MKHLKFSFIAVIIVMLFSSCGKEILDENPNEPLKKGKKKQVSLVINEDITVSEMSLFVPNPSLTGIIIFHKFSVCFEGFRFAKYLIISRSVF